MLVLTRKANQQIRIGSDIVVTVLRIRGKSVQLGIEAPADTEVLRSELLDKPLRPQSCSEKPPNTADGAADRCTSRRAKTGRVPRDAPLPKPQPSASVGPALPRRLLAHSVWKVGLAGVRGVERALR